MQENLNNHPTRKEVEKMAKTTKLSKEVEELKKFKEENNMTLEELGNKINIQGTTLSQYFNGTVQPLPNTLAKIQKFLNQRIFTFANVDGTQYVDSRLIAEWTEKNHKDLLRDIRSYITHLEQLQSKSTERNFEPYEISMYFVESSYQNSRNKMSLPCYLVTQKGCEMIANKMIGVKGTKFTALYINEFHRMKEALQSEDKPTTHPTNHNQPKQLKLNLEESPELSYIKQRVKNFDKCRDLKQCLFELLSVYRVLKVLIDEEGGTLANELRHIGKKVEEEKEGHK